MSFGGVMIDYDFRTAVGELDPAIRRPMFGSETPRPTSRACGHRSRRAVTSCRTS